MKVRFANIIQNSCIWLLLVIILTLLMPVSIKADSQLNKKFSVSSWIADLSADITAIGLENDSYQELNNPDQFNLLKTDHIIYYELLDQWFSFDLGISLMNFDGNISTPSVNPENYQDLDIYVPTCYGKIQFTSTMTTVSVGIETSLFSIGQNSISDYKIYLGWKSYSKIQFEMGYKQFILDYNDINFSNGIQIFNGYYTSVSLPF